MKIKRLRLKGGYKRFHDLTIDLGDNPRRIIALVGPNGSGKSSVLDGLMFRQSMNMHIGSTSARGNVYHSIDGVTPVGRQNIEIDFTEGEYNAVYNRKAKTGEQGTIFSFRSPYRYNSQLNITQTKQVQKISNNDYGASSASDLDAKMEQNYRRLHSAYNKYRDDTDSRPSEAKAKIIGDLNASIERCIDLKISSLGDIESSRGTLYFIKNDQDSEFPFDVLSSGEKEVVDILLDLYLRRDDYSDTVFLFDEPELHINTSMQKALLQEIDKLVPENCQIWLTTHSIGFLRALQKDFKESCQVIHFRRDLKLGSEPVTLTPLRSSHLEWREIFSIALDDLVHLVSPRRIIYCEGRDTPGSGGSERGLDAKVYNAIFAERHPDTLFVSSGGNTELDQRSAIAIAILTKVFPELEIWILKDRDIASGEEATEKTRQLYLKQNADNHRVLRRREIENYLFDKEILQKYCIENGLTFEEEAYDAFVTSISDQNLKDDLGLIRSFCGIKTSINAEKFKVLLAEHITSDTAVYQDLADSIFY